MNKDIFKARVTAIISIFVMWIVAILAGVLSFATNYFIYFFLAVTSAFLASTNTFFLLLKYIDHLSKEPKVKKVKKKKRKKKEAVEDEDEELQVEEKKPRKKLRMDIYKVATALTYILYIVIFYLCNVSVWDYVKKLQGQTLQSGKALYGVLALILFVIFVVVDRVCKYAEDEDEFSMAINENGRIFSKLLCFQCLLSVVYVIYTAFNFLTLQIYVAYAFAASFYYFVVFITLSLVVVAIRKEFCIAPYLNVPLPMFKKKGMEHRKGFIDYLESNTGISMRSLWSVKYIRQIAPTVVLLSGIFLWLSTCVVQVDSYQQAAVYRIGVLQSKMLGPGIHLRLPYPFDKVEIYDTESIQKTTIGYRSEENTDNIWTGGHGEGEHKLLLGSGDELVSINLRLEYKISDLKKYLKTSSMPEAQMEALAYELVTDQTIATDLNSFMSTDREKFSENFKKELSKKMKEKELGLEVVSVVLESIHPPVEIASVYQELISAEISAQKFLRYAEGNAAANIATAEKEAYTLKGNAQVENTQRLSASKAEVTTFSASVQAYKEHGDAYTYQKRLNAVREAYKKANLVILGSGVEESMLYFGSVTGSEKTE